MNIPGRVEKINLNLPADVVVENAGPDATISASAGKRRDSMP